MTQRVVAQVAVEQTTFHFDRLYSYDAGEWSNDIACGCRVLVPFGKGNRRRQGIVMALTRDDEQETAPLKPIVTLLDRQPLLNQELLDLALFLKEHTFCTLFDAVRAMVPAGLCLYVQPVYLPAETDETALDEAQRQVYVLARSLVKKYPQGIRYLMF